MVPTQWRGGAVRRATAASLQPSGAALTVRHGTPPGGAGSGRWQIGLVAALVLPCATPLAQEGTSGPHITPYARAHRVQVLARGFSIDSVT